MNEKKIPRWSDWEQIIRRDPGGRGVASYVHAGHPIGKGELERAATDLAANAGRVMIVTGFAIIDADPIAAETDGPPGALFLARTLEACGIEVVLASDGYALPLLRCGADARGSSPHKFEFVELPMAPALSAEWADALLDRELMRGLSHLVAIERAGPSHTVESIAANEGPEMAARFASDVPPEHRNAHHNMRGKIIDSITAPAGELFDRIMARQLPITTIGIGDGGNELGMGLFAWSFLCQAIGIGPASHTACRISTDHAIIAGVSNWGAYALSLAVAALRGQTDLIESWTADNERDLIERLVGAGAVDGVTKQRAATVDGLAMDDYLSALESLRRLALGGK